MELSFQSHPYRFLHRVMQEVRFQEETAEIIVPDSYPDIGSIADSCAEAILRGKDCRDGGVTVAGGVRAVVLYMPEDLSYPRNLETYMPFTVKFEHPALSAQTQVLCNIRVRSVDARMINSRKAMVRVNLGCELIAFEDTTDLCYKLDSKDPCLQTKESVYTTIVPLETGEKSFSINDTVELPTGRPVISRVYTFQCHADLSDEKLVGNKAVFKGQLRYKLIYLSEDEKLCVLEQSIPFSQYCELQSDYDEETVSTQFVITGYDLDVSQINEQGLPVSVNILAQCVISGTQTVTLIEDAYSTGGILRPQWKEQKLEGYLDRQNITQTIRHRLTGDMQEVVDANIYWDFAEVSRNEDKASVKIPALIRVLGYDENGSLCSMTAKAEAVYETALSDGAACFASAVPVGEVTFAPETNGVEVRGAVKITVQCSSREKINCLCGGETEELESDGKRPALIVRMVEKETPLWDLAKNYGTTVENIQSANSLDSDVLLKDSVLLLPIM